MISGRGEDLPATTNSRLKRQHRFPPGWNHARVREVPAHYEDQTEDEPFAEIEAAHETARITLIAVPTELIPAVRALIARRAGA